MWLKAITADASDTGGSFGISHDVLVDPAAHEKYLMAEGIAHVQ